MTLKLAAPHWRQIQRNNFTNCDKLVEFLELTETQKEEIFKGSRFILNLPLRLAEKIKKGTLNDPIFKQFIPTKNETVATDGFVSDPVGDSACRRGSKLLHKYNGRVLLVCTSACAMHCRYCFRQNFDYDVDTKSFDDEIELITQDPSIHEVILSGGDPLSLSDASLESLMRRLSLIPHINRIRIHSRFMVGIPERIDDAFISLMESLPQQIWFVIHCNHVKELDEEIYSRIRRLQQAGVIVLNQAVLLKGVNDSVSALKDLCESLVDHGVLPYYLHQLDRVQGAAHFEVPEERGHELIEELRGELAGYAIPTYVREIAGEPSKTPLVNKG